MKVTLIEYTGSGHADPMHAAKLLVYTKNTRLEQGGDTRAKIAAMPPEELAAELDYMAKTLRSSWEFVDYIFEIKDVTRAFTHQLVRTRTGSYAQQAQRVVDMGNFETAIPDSVMTVDGGTTWESLMDAISETYKFYSECGVPNQDCRGVLPTNVLTNIIVKFNLRTMADIVGKRENLRAQGEYSGVVSGMKAEILRVHPWVMPFINPDRTHTPALEALLKEALGDKSPIDKPEINAALKELDALKGIWG